MPNERVPYKWARYSEFELEERYEGDDNILNRRLKEMAVLKNFFIVLFVLSAVNLCLARPKWLWIGDDVEEEDPMVAKEPGESDVTEMYRFENEETSCTFAGDKHRCLGWSAMIRRLDDLNKNIIACV